MYGAGFVVRSLVGVGVMDRSIIDVGTDKELIEVRRVAECD